MSRLSQRSSAAVLLGALCLLAGCANPGPPKPPSLQIPAVVTDLSARRQANEVQLQFTLPQRTADGVTLRPGVLTARLCRAVDTGTCLPLGAGGSGIFAVPPSAKVTADLNDKLPATLTAGAPHLLTYRVELFRQGSRSAGFSDAAYAAAGAAPPRITELRAQGSRLGVVLQWQNTGDNAEVLLRREDLNSRPAGASLKAGKAADEGHGKLALGSLGSGAKLAPSRVQPAVVTLNAFGSADTRAALMDGIVSATLDTTAVADLPYRYTAERHRVVQVGGHKLELWSDPSAPITFTLRDNFPPPAPTSLSVAGFFEQDAKPGTGVFAVDLIWEPVEDEQLAGYWIYREELSPKDGAHRIPEVLVPRALLTASPVKLPAFHDTTASGSRRYRYSVTSVDLKGNESEAATAVLEPQ